MSERGSQVLAPAPAPLAQEQGGGVGERGMGLGRGRWRERGLVSTTLFLIGNKLILPKSSLFYQW